MRLSLLWLLLVALGAAGIVAVFRSPKCISGPSIRPAEAIIYDHARTLAEARAVQAEDRRVEAEVENAALRQRCTDLEARVRRVESELATKAQMWDSERAHLHTALDSVAEERDAVESETRAFAVRLQKMNEENVAMNAKLKKRKCWLF
jgi:predicted  nucleic acid-binding Zn-ribbon protein